MSMLVSYRSVEFIKLCSEFRKSLQRNPNKWEPTTTS